MRSFCAVLTVVMLVAASAFAGDGVMPETNTVSQYDRLVATPMTCMMPTSPSLMLDNAESPVDMVKLGAMRVSDFMQDVSIYLGCLGNQAKIVATNLYGRFTEFMRSKLNKPKNNDQDAEN